MSKKVYTIKTSAYVTVFVSDEYTIEASDPNAAEAKAFEDFRELIDEKYSPWCEIKGLRVDYTEVAKHG